MIEGAVLKNLKRIDDDRGWLMEMMRNDWGFKDNVQTYVTSCKPGVAKAWHYHKKQEDHFVVVKGVALVVLYDPREDSKTKGELNEFILSPQQPQLLKIPIGVYHGFTAISEDDARIVNMPTRLYDYKEPDEYRLPYDDKSIGYDWRCKSGG